jgi:hypothetical protein
LELKQTIVGRVMVALDPVGDLPLFQDRFQQPSFNLVFQNQYSFMGIHRSGSSFLRSPTPWPGNHLHRAVRTWIVFIRKTRVPHEAISRQQSGKGILFTRLLLKAER